MTDQGIAQDEQGIEMTAEGNVTSSTYGFHSSTRAAPHRPPKTIVKPTALGPVANTDTKLLIYGLFQKGRVLAQDDI